MNPIRLVARVAAFAAASIALAVPAGAQELIGDRLSYEGDVVPVTSDLNNPAIPGWTASPDAGGGTFDLAGLSASGGDLLIDSWPSPHALFTPVTVFDDFAGSGSTLETNIEVTAGKLFFIFYDGDQQFQSILEPDRITWIKINPPEAPSVAVDLTGGKHRVRYVMADNTVRIYVNDRLKLNTSIGDGAVAGVSRLQLIANDAGALPSAAIDYIRIATGAVAPDPFLGDRLELEGDVVPVTADLNSPNIPGWTATPDQGGGTFDLAGLDTDGENLVFTEWPAPYSLFSPQGVFDDFGGSGNTIETRIQVTAGRLYLVFYDGSRQFQVQFRTTGVFWLKIDPAEAPFLEADLSSDFRVVRFVVDNANVRVYVDGVLGIDEPMGNGGAAGVSQLQIIALDGNNLPTAAMDYLRIGTGAILPDSQPVESSSPSWHLYQ